MSLDFKLFEVKSATTNSIIFQAYVRDYKTYRITEDLTGRFKNKFLRIMSGDYKNSLINNETSEENSYFIDGDDPIENLKKYRDECNTFSKSIVSIEDTNISHQFTLHFIGSDYNMDKGMDPLAAKKANDFFYSLSNIMTTPISINNTDYKGAEEFTIYEAASLKMEMYSSLDFPHFRETLETLLNDINNESLSSEATLGNCYLIYKKLFRTFCELYKFENLDKLKISVEGYQDKTIIDFDSIPDLASNIYGNRITGNFVIQTVKDYYREQSHDGLIVDTRDFSELTTWKYSKNKVLSDFLYTQKGENVKLEGYSSGERSRDLVSVEFLRDQYSFSTHDKQKFTENDIEVVSNNKIKLL